ncbi:DNA polymerase II large subunit [uncultured archaeon]|nr:DNA polymerase II large subunit [uncultured archaeon]
MIASVEMSKYFNGLKSEVARLHSVASQARSRGFDPAKVVEVSLAENMAQRVVGLISVVAPQIVNSGVVERIIELEAQFGSLDWRVALKIAEEIALEKFCKFESRQKAMEMGIRTGFAYVTVGVVSSPLDGIVSIEVKKRMDNRGEYICVNFAGPIRNAGGTAAAVSVIITDYVRKCLGYDVYDAQPDEIRRASTELQDYHERVTNLQYYPSEPEIEFLLKNLPVEVSGDASEKIEVSNFKDLPRVPTNQIRSGYCLVLSSCIPLKAPKLWKQLSVWGKYFNLDSWNFLDEFLHIQKKAKAGKQQAESHQKIAPDYTYISDLVAGRPVLGYPLRPGGFRLRYGRCRTSGFSAQSIHPATMYILNQYIATGTQLKTERPGKAASMTSCDSIEGPVVKLLDGSVLQVHTMDDAKRVQPFIKEILFLGDILVSYGDFFNRAHPLAPAGYCHEWWLQEVKRSLNDVPPISSAQEAVALARATKTSLHPAYACYWNLLSNDEFRSLLDWLDTAKVHTTELGIQKIVLPANDAKRCLELVGLPHLFVNNEFVVIERDFAVVLAAMFHLIDEKPSSLKRYIADGSVLDAINQFSPFIIRDKAGTFIGTRMGRPEKAKQRELTGSPHVLFPVGDEGGRLRSFQSALSAGRVTADFSFFFCQKCNAETVLGVCEVCGSQTVQKWRCERCGLQDSANCSAHGPNDPSSERSIPIKHYFDSVLSQLGIQQYPELIKGVRGTSNKEHIPEALAKGILRARYDVHVYKDGTTRYDMTQLPITHFKPCEIGSSIERLKELGYVKDIYGFDLVNDNQILELKPQDIVLPSCSESPDDGADKVLANVSHFVDDALEFLYGLPRLYNIASAQDLIGHVVVVLAPHTSAGIVGRIIGFSKTQGLFAHPLLHAATRRDCDGDEACVVLLMDAFLNFSKKYLPSSRGSTMDTPLVLTSVLTPSEVDDMVFDMDVASQYPLELYEAALQYKAPWEVKVSQVKSRLNKPEQYEGMMFTHDVSNLNQTVRCSAYKTLPSMEDKLKGQMDLAEKLRSVDASDVARLVIEKHFLKDTKGNLRKFSMQEFRCVACNEKFRRPPLVGKCTKCNGKIIFTVSEGSVSKYLEPTISLAKKYNVSPYLQQTIELLKVRLESVFGKDPDKQVNLGAWFG